MDHQTPKTKKTIRVIVSGRVQMVMYRDFAQRKARRLGIVGTVRNLDNGTVEVVAQGTEEILNRYLTKLRRGSVLSRVADVQVSWIESNAEFSEFGIVYEL